MAQRCNDEPCKSARFYQLAFSSLCPVNKMHINGHSAGASWQGRAPRTRPSTCALYACLSLREGGVGDAVCFIRKVMVFRKADHSLRRLCELVDLCLGCNASRNCVWRAHAWPNTGPEDDGTGQAGEGQRYGGGGVEPVGVVENGTDQYGRADPVPWPRSGTASNRVTRRVTS